MRSCIYRTVVYNQCMCWYLTGSVLVLLGWWGGGGGGGGEGGVNVSL